MKIFVMKMKFYFCIVFHEMFGSHTMIHHTKEHNKKCQVAIFRRARIIAIKLFYNMTLLVITQIYRQLKTKHGQRHACKE